METKTVQDQMRDALGVIVLDPKVRAWLALHDPKAYVQAVDAFVAGGGVMPGGAEEEPSYGMYTPEGNRLVHQYCVQAALASAAPREDDDPDIRPAELRRRAHTTLEAGLGLVQVAGFREVYDTDVREQVYGAVGATLRMRGLASDRFNWETE